jgi:hypothetical protein
LFLDGVLGKRNEFARKGDLVAVSGEGLAEHGFCSAFGITLGGIEMSDSAIQSMADEILVGLKTESTETNIRDFELSPTECRATTNLGRVVAAG